MNAFQTATNTRIKISQNNDFFPDTIDRVIAITGQPENVTAGLAMVIEKMCDVSACVACVIDELYYVSVRINPTPPLRFTSSIDNPSFTCIHIFSLLFIHMPHHDLLLRPHTSTLLFDTPLQPLTCQRNDTPHLTFIQHQSMTSYQLHHQHGQTQHKLSFTNTDHCPKQTNKSISQHTA